MATDRIRSHGWVTPLPDGAVARCGGPGLCSHCQLEQALVHLKAAVTTVANVAAAASEDMLRAQGRAERAEHEADDALAALADLLAAVNLLHSVAGTSATPTSLDDPTHVVVANAVAGPALAAGQVLQRAGRYEWIAEAPSASLGVNSRLQGS